MTTPNKDVPAAATSSDTETSRKSSKGILCAKCEHVNRAGATTCSRCRAHLHVKCNDCGTVNERVLTMCKSCGRRLHKNFVQKAVSRFGGLKFRFKLMHVALFVVVVGAIFWVVVTLARLQLPGPQN